MRDSYDGGRRRQETTGTAVLGAGSAGLTAAYLLGPRGANAVVPKADDAAGGIARTVAHDGYRFDLGGHPLFTKLRPVQEFREEMLGDELLQHPRPLALLPRSIPCSSAAGEGRERRARGMNEAA